MSLCATLLVLLASPAQAQLKVGRLEFSMYGRVGLAWDPTSGNHILGKRMNLTGSALGGRLEEGDYLEPTFTLHLLNPPSEDAAAPVSNLPSVRLVFTPSVFARNGLFLSFFSNQFAETVQVELFQAYLEATNVGLPGLTLWIGSRFYRGPDVHIADYFYFNDQTGQGAGAKYGPLDVAVRLQTAENDPLYAIDLDRDGTADARRQRTLFIGQYVQPLGTTGHSLHLLGEFHLLPELKAGGLGGERVLPAEQGWVLGVRGHMELGDGSFNDLSVRYGRGIANGSLAGSRTWSTFGRPNANGMYDGAYGIEVVDHFLYNFGSRVGFNAYGTFHMSRGSSGRALDRSLDFAVGERTVLYVTDWFHFITEASFQGLRVAEGAPMATAAKFTLMPTLVPTAKRSVWARPHLRLIYTLAIYDQDAQDLVSAPYLQTVGPSSTGHYLGFQVEWF